MSEAMVKPAPKIRPKPKKKHKIPVEPPPPPPPTPDKLAASSKGSLTVPAKPEKVITLEEVLAMFKNDRSFTLIRSHGNSWKVLFEGDYFPSIISFVNGKPKIITSSKTAAALFEED